MDKQTYRQIDRQKDRYMEIWTDEKDRKVKGEEKIKEEENKSMNEYKTR